MVASNRDQQIRNQVRRRTLLTTVTGAVFLVPLSGIAQQKPGQVRVEWLAHGDTMPRHFFEEALARLGWIEGKNLTIEHHFEGSTGEHLSAAAQAIVASHPDVIVAMGMIDARPLLELTKSIPIVVVTAGDPVGAGIAASLAKPGGNVTGTASITNELFPKLLELVRDLIPQLGRISVLGDPRNPAFVRASPSLGEALGLTITTREVSQPDELDAVLEAAVRDGDRAVVVQFSALTFENMSQIITHTRDLRLPAVYPLREYVEAGGLASYGPAIRDNFERAALLTDKILRGANPGDLPIEQPTKFELVVNLRTAKSLGLIVPQSLLARADEVID